MEKEMKDLIVEGFVIMFTLGAAFGLTLAGLMRI